MVKGVHSFEERNKMPWLEVLDFEYILNHPEVKVEILNEIRTNYSLRNQINNMRIIDKSFRVRFDNLFKDYIETKSVTLKLKK